MNGRYVENLVIAKIEQKCDIKTDPNFDHTYKLDFVINRFKSIDKMIPIGVQITTRLGDFFKIQEFLKERHKKILVDKSIYIEIHPDVDVYAWGSELIYSALTVFAFQKSTDIGEIAGVRINPDISYEFFDLEAVSENRSAAMETDKSFSGRIVRFKRNNGYGLIEAPEGSWFLHVDHIVDDRLKNSFVPNIQVDSSGKVLRPIYVDFENGGFRRPDAKYPLATKIRLSSKSN